MIPALSIIWNVDPIIFHIGSFGVRWYSLGFLCAFVLGYYIMYRIFVREKVDVAHLESLLIYIFIAVLLGARLGHCLFYEPDYFITSEHWSEIVLPFSATTGEFTGFQGLASHGAAIGILLALWLYYRKYNLNVWWFLDRFVIVVALGGAFVRLGNLFNSEIYGHPTTLPWGFVFVRNGEVFPKHPTQLYEAISYLIIFAVSLWMYRKKEGKLHTGRLFGYWLIALFGVRLLIEFVKENQVDFESGMLLDMGQLLSIPFIIGGIVMVWLSYTGRLSDKPFYGNDKRQSKSKKK